MIKNINVTYEVIKPRQKHCNKCGVVKELFQFTKVKKVKSGRGGICSECTNNRNKERYRNEEGFRESKKKASQKYRDKQKLKNENKKNIH